MDLHILIALTGALINMVLSTTVPCLIKQTNRPFLTNVKKVFETNRQLILTSSLIVAITIYMALKVVEEVNQEESFNLSDTPTFDLSGLPGLLNNFKNTRRSSNALTPLARLGESNCIQNRGYLLN